MKLNRAKLKQIILEVLREEEEQVQTIPVVKVSMTQKEIPIKDLSRWEKDGYSSIEKAKVEVEEVDRMIQDLIDSYKSKQALNPEDEPEQETT